MIIFLQGFHLQYEHSASKQTITKQALPEMAYSPLGDATVTADAFPMLSTGPRPTWLLKLRTCQPITLASCWTACTWCWDICSSKRWSQWGSVTLAFRYLNLVDWGTDCVWQHMDQTTVQLEPFSDYLLRADLATVAWSVPGFTKRVHFDQILKQTEPRFGLSC